MSTARRRNVRTRRFLVVSVAARRPALRRGLGGWLEQAAPRTARGTLDIAIVEDAEIRRLNREFRGVDASTDVLSFPSEGTPAPGAADRPDPLPHLGDIAIARGVAHRQAREQGHSLNVELRILALHGLLHLLGYDHETDAGRMRRLEERLRRRAGLPSGLIARTPLTDGRA